MLARDILPEVTSGLWRTRERLRVASVATPLGAKDESRPSGTPRFGPGRLSALSVLRARLEVERVREALCVEDRGQVREAQSCAGQGLTIPQADYKPRRRRLLKLGAGGAPVLSGCGQGQRCAPRRPSSPRPRRRLGLRGVHLIAPRGPRPPTWRARFLITTRLRATRSDFRRHMINARNEGLDRALSLAGRAVSLGRGA